MKRIAVVLVLLSGCSWVFASKPSPRSACGVYSAMAGFDAIEAGSGAILGLYGLAYSTNGKSDADTIGVAGAVVLGIAALFGASAQHGFERGHECRELARPRRWITPSTLARS